MSRRILLTCSLLALLTACIQVTTTPTIATVKIPASATAPSVTPPAPSLRTQVHETTSPTLPEASVTPDEVPRATPQPLPSLQITPAATTTPALQPSANSGAIQFLGPGPLSKIVSSIKAFGYAIPGYNNKGRLDLYGEDGRVVATQLLQLNTPYKWAYFYWELPFKVTSVGELGRLSLSTQDEYGRINAVNSVHLLLLSEGTSLINPPDDLNERCIIDLPVPGQRISGGILTVSGKMHPFNSLPLTVELVARDGTVLGIQLVPISPSAENKYTAFRVDVPYGIKQGTWALLVVQQNDDRIGGIMYLFSREIYLSP